MSWRNKGGGASTAKKQPASEESNEVKIEIGKNKFVSVSQFKGKVNVQIREYYEKDGELFPSKKGLAMSVEQWDKLKELIPAIDAALGEEGEDPS